ncbi:MAG: hypothetical protein ABSB74_21430 [Tepidisphaeraceae bacterium]
MKRWISLSATALIVCLTVFAWGQWQAQPQIDPRVGPVYPVNPAYNFYSQSNYNPFQFNWGTGQWDYVPIPDESSQLSREPAPPPGPVPYLPYGGDQRYPLNYGRPQTLNPAAQSNPPAAQGKPPAPKPDDSGLWSGPTTRTTRPAQTVAPRIVKFAGRIVAIKAVEMFGEPNPHLLLRLRNDAGATGTVDAGLRLVFPDAAFDPGAKGHVAVTGQLGILDGQLVLFADQIVFGSQTVTIDRPGKSTAK